MDLSELVNTSPAASIAGRTLFQVSTSLSNLKQLVGRFGNMHVTLRPRTYGTTTLRSDNEKEHGRDYIHLCVEVTFMQTAVRCMNGARKNEMTAPV